MSAPRVLVLYSNPADTSRLRLDVEHAQLEAAVREAGQHPSVLRRVHASRVQDLVYELSANTYEILQFSGHGSEEGILLESDDRSSSALLDIAGLQEILALAPRSLRAVILTCCFSDSYRSDIARLAPYLVSVIGPAADSAAIMFSRHFFTHYLRGDCSIERAISLTLPLVQSENGIVLSVSRRGLLNDPGELVIRGQIDDTNTILINLTTVRDSVDKMEPRDQERFLMSLCNRIRAHFEIFYDAMDRVAIPFGQFVGIFSWKNEVDHIRCERLFEVADRVTEDELTAVNLALGVYTKMAQLPYRRQRARDYPSKPRVVADSVARFHSWLEHLLIESISNQLRNLAPAAFKVAFSTIRANLAEADHDILHEDFADAVVRMEIALTTLHSFNMQLLDEIEA